MATNEPKNSENRATQKPSTRKPHRISKIGWKQMLSNAKNGVSKHHLSIVAAGVAFFAMLGIFPGLAATISIYGLVSDPEEIKNQFAAMQGLMPDEANELLLEQMSRIAEERATAGLGAAFGILLALWAGSRATKAAMEGLNITYEKTESRGAIAVALIGLGLTLALILCGLLAIAVIVVVPPLLAALPLPAIAETALSLIRWPLLLFIGIIAITVLYRFGPSKRQPKWKWLTWGSATAAILWLVISALFSLYAGNFANYNETYGSIGAIIVLLMWLYLSAFAILLGAELDAAMEKQTKEDVFDETA